PHGPEPVAAELLLRPRDAVGCAEAVVAGHRCQRRQGAGDGVRTCSRQWPRGAGAVEGGVTRHPLRMKTPASSRRFFMGEIGRRLCRSDVSRDRTAITDIREIATYVAPTWGVAVTPVPPTSRRQSPR